MFEILPTALTNPPKTVNRLLKEVADEAGPLFIVLDEIGDAFVRDDLDDIERRKRFLSFIDNVVGKWLLLKKIFFVLIGKDFDGAPLVPHNNSNYAFVLLATSTDSVEGDVY